MLRRTLLLTLLFFLPTIATAGWGVVFDANEIEMYVGEVRTLGVHIVWLSGFSYYAFPLSQFYSDDERVAIVGGQLPMPPPANVLIAAVGPGYATIQRRTIANGWNVRDANVGITVKCAQTEPLRLALKEPRTRVGQPVTLSAIVERPDLLDFTWYLGRIGDTSHPLSSAASGLTFTPSTAGSHYIWVSAVNGCTNASAEARIDATQPRRRSVR